MSNPRKVTSAHARHVLEIAELRRILLVMLYDRLRDAHPQDIYPHPEVWPDDMVKQTLKEIIRV